MQELDRVPCQQIASSPDEVITVRWLLVSSERKWRCIHFSLCQWSRLDLYAQVNCKALKCSGGLWVNKPTSKCVMSPIANMDKCFIHPVHPSPQTAVRNQRWKSHQQRPQETERDTQVGSSLQLWPVMAIPLFTQSR